MQPLSPCVEEFAHAMRTKIKRHMPIQILLAEDAESDIMLTECALDETYIPHQLHTVGSGTDVLRYLRHDGEFADKPAPDLILLDLTMPQKDGFEVLAELTQEAAFARIPIIILTGAFMVGITSLFYGRFRPHLSSSAILYLCFLFQGAGITIMGLSHTPVPIALGCGILGVGTGIANPLISDWIVARASSEIRARAIGASYTMRYVGDFANPFIMKPLGALIGLHTAFTLVGAIFLASVGAFALWRQTPTARRGAETAAE